MGLRHPVRFGSNINVIDLEEQCVCDVDAVCCSVLQCVAVCCLCLFLCLFVYLLARDIWVGCESGSMTYRLNEYVCVLCVLSCRFRMNKHRHWYVYICTHSHELKHTPTCMRALSHIRT